MPKSQAVSTDFNNLLSKIEKQSHEYVKAFNDINKFLRSADRMRRSVEETLEKCNTLYTKNLELYEKFSSIEQYINMRFKQLFDQIRKILTETIISDFNLKVEELFVSFEDRTRKALGLLEEDEGILDLYEKVKHLITEADSKMEEVDKKLFSLEEKVTIAENNNKEMKVAVKNTHTKLDDQIVVLKDKTYEVENKIYKYFDAMYEKYDAMLKDLGFNLEDRIKKTIVDLKDSQFSISQKVRNTDEKMNNIVTLSNELFKHIKELKEKTHKKSKGEKQDKST